MLCDSKIPSIGFHKARQNMLVVGMDLRPYMREAYRLFRGEATEEDLARQASPSTPAEFYSLLYLGLFNEAKGETEKARSFIRTSVATPYARIGRDYMTSLAKVHLQLRGWV